MRLIRAPFFRAEFLFGTAFPAFSPDLLDAYELEPPNACVLLRDRVKLVEGEMRRSASPSKSQGVRLPPRSRGDKSTAVLKAAFRPLSGLPQRPSQPNPSSTSSPIKPVLAPLAPRSIEELQTEITEAELVLS